MLEEKLLAIDLRQTVEISRRRTQSHQATCDVTPRAIDDLDFALRQPERVMQLRLLTIRARALTRQGRRTEVADTAEQLRKLEPEDAKALYNVACCYALCVSAAGDEKTNDQLAIETEAIRARYTALAIETLNLAVERGWNTEPHAAHLEKDAELNPIRHEPGFRELWKKLWVSVLDQSLEAT